LLTLRDSLPVWAAVSEASLHDLQLLDQVPLQKGAFYVMDRGYLDFTRLARWQRSGAYFVVRSKCHVSFRVQASRPVDKETGLRCDQTIRLARPRSRRAFPEPLRRLRVYDETQGRSFVLLSNQFELPAQTMAQLYRRRWQVELFFKWIKQHLRLETFLGRSPNAVRLQVWSAICAYLLVAIAKKQLRLPQTLHQILQVLSVSIFEPVPLAKLFATTSDPISAPRQLLLIP
jgi:IS4 transposase